MKKLLLAVALAFLATGCSTRVGDFTMVSTKNVDLSHGADFKLGVAKVKGEDSKPIILYFPIGQPDMKTAIDRAIESTPGAIALTDVVITRSAVWFILGGQNTIEVEGTALIDPNLSKR